MPPLILPFHDPSALARAADILRHDGLVAFATDTVYGIGAILRSRTGIARIYALKGRSHEKAIPILIAEVGQLSTVATAITRETCRLIDAFWPGALTIILPRHDSLLPELAPGQHTIGVRFPNHDGVRALIAMAGAPIACSSANLSGQPAAMSASEVAEAFPHGLDLILDGGRSTSDEPSTVVDASLEGSPRIVREGAINRSAVARALGVTL